MVIQRWQNLLLFIAIILVGLFIATPLASVCSNDSVSSTPIYVYSLPVLLILCSAIALLLVVALCRYKNLKQQKAITVMALVLLCTALIIGAIIIAVVIPGATPVWFGGLSLCVVAALCTALAYRFIRKDINLLRSYDRLR